MFTQNEAQELERRCHYRLKSAISKGSALEIPQGAIMDAIRIEPEQKGSKAFYVLFRPHDRKHPNCIPHHFTKRDFEVFFEPEPVNMDHEFLTSGE